VNKNKIIFAVIWVILIILLLIWLIAMKWWKKGWVVTKNASWTFKIWIVWDKKSSFESVLTHFKEKNKSFSSVDYEVESFPNYEEYSNALTSAIIKWVAPDLFVINNNETSIFEEKILAIPEEIINTNGFRKSYEWVFIDDLLIKGETKDEDGSYDEFLKWLPVWYETLGIFYNRKFWFSQSDFASFADLKKWIKRIKRHWLIPLAIWNWSTVSSASDILSHLFLLNKIKWLKDSNSSKSKVVLYDYTKYGSIESYNWYNKLFASSKRNWETDLELFKDGKVAAIVGFPRLLEKMKIMWFSRNLILAEPFPHLFKNDDKPTYVNYNYFVINKDTSQKDTAFSLLQYLNSTEWAELYLSKFKYYLPAQTQLVDKLWQNKVTRFFNSIIIKNFYPNKFILSSFDKGDKVLFDKWVKHVLDDFSNYTESFQKFKESLLCKSEKKLTLSKLSVSCD